MSVRKIYSKKKNFNDKTAFLFKERLIPFGNLNTRKTIAAEQNFIKRIYF
jgi:hypothetical protein